VYLKKWDQGILNLSKDAKSISMYMSFSEEIPFPDQV
jgi:hypothetical protein